MTTLRGPLVVCALFALAATALRAQTEYPVSSLDSLDRVRDSTLTADCLIVAADSTRIDEFQKIVTIYKQRHQHGLQMSAALRMVAANPASSMAYFLYGDALLDSSRPSDAIPVLQRALVITPEFVRARIALAEAHEMLKQTDSALWQIDTAITYNGRNADAYLRRARLLSSLGRESESIDDYRAASELLPNNATVWRTLGRLILRYGSPLEAVRVLDYAIELDSNAPDPFVLRADALRESGQTQRAAEAYSQFFLRFPTHPRALEAERIARDLGWRP